MNTYYKIKDDFLKKIFVVNTMKPIIENQKLRNYMLPIIKTIQQFFQFFMRFLDNGYM